ncbi:AAA family ATPase [Ferruginibacter sp.]|nr:ATP-binding protein [Ferruginibacter sp.]
MKLLNIHIDSHLHLENISFDFTYPKGHSKAGLPLEKICIIGQSATGKTSILDLIRNSILKLDSLEIINESILDFRNNDVNFTFKGDIEFEINNEKLKILETEVIKGSKLLQYGSASGSIGRLISKGMKLFFLSSDIISKEAIDLFNQNPANIDFNENAKRLSTIRKLVNRDRNYIYQFTQNIDQNAWYSLLSEILEYRKRFTQMASELINKGAIGDLKKLNKEFEKWALENKNPLVKFADFFNPILKRLNLEVDLVNTEFSIPIKSKINEEVIPISNLSTGTKGLLLSMFPLYELDTNNALILIDEPERSLFPDMQIDLIENYHKVAPNAQIIVATHSPFIAAAFEPEERFILYFDDKGKVAVRRGVSPIGDDPNDILKNDFNVDYYNKFGQEAYKKYISLKEQMANEGNLQKKKELLKEVSSLGDQYKF